MAGRQTGLSSAMPRWVPQERRRATETGKGQCIGLHQATPSEGRVRARARARARARGGGRGEGLGRESWTEPHQEPGRGGERVPWNGRAWSRLLKEPLTSRRGNKRTGGEARVMVILNPSAA